MPKGPHKPAHSVSISNLHRNSVLNDHPEDQSLNRTEKEVIDQSNSGALRGSIEPYVAASEAAEFLGIHPKTLMKLARQGGVPAYWINEGERRRWRFLKSELDIWMRSSIDSTLHPVRSVS
jgi:excisionase family DNA binding protein